MLISGTSTGCPDRPSSRMIIEGRHAVRVDPWALVLILVEGGTGTQEDEESQQTTTDDGRGLHGYPPSQKGFRQLPSVNR